MRSVFSLCAGLALVAAAPAPAPQNIDFDLVDALPAPTYTVAVGVSAQVVAYDPTAILSAAQSQITSDVASNAITATGTLAKRTACAPQPTGAKNAPNVTADTPAAFVSNALFSSVAVNAPTPSGYVQRFQNMNASNNAYGYLGYTTLDSYDTNLCASKCNAVKGCSSINIYFERDPSVDPAAACPNPPSYTMIKCVFWGGPVTTANAVNVGQWRQNFQVVIAGSNGYESSYATPPGYATPVALTAAINAPYDVYGYDSYMGVALFNSGPFDLQLCADACSMKSQYALAHPPTDGSPVQTCQFFNTYILYVNNLTNPQGQYCAMYSESWNSTYATNPGQWRGSDYYLVGNSYAVSNITNPESTNKKAAVYQASKDISYWTLQSYCSTKFATTTTATATAYTTRTVTQIVPFTTTVTVQPAHKRDVDTSAAIATLANTDAATTGANSALPTITGQAQLPVLAPAANGSAPLLTVSLESNAVFTTNLADVHSIVKRAASSAAATPTVLTKYPSDVVSSACALQPSATHATATVTSTTTLSTSTTTVISSSTTTVTVTAANTAAISPTANPSPTARPFLIKVLSGPDAGQFFGKDPANTAANMNLLTLVPAKAQADVFHLADDGTLMQADWFVQGASSGGSYSGIGAADGLFANGEALMCSVSNGGVLRCETESNAHNVFGLCPAYSWLWLFGQVGDVDAFCPGGSGALKLGVVPA